MTRSHVLAFALLGSLLPGCGGGGSGADGAVDVFTPNPAPTFTVGVAFLADAEVDERIELYVADLDGDGSLKVSGQLVAGGDVHSFQWSPDRTVLAFVADRDTDELRELYVVPATGGAVTNVSRPLVAGDFLLDFQWSPDSTRIAYGMYPAGKGALELFSVAAQGGPSASVTGPMPADAGVQSYGWAPDAKRIAYVADQDKPGTPELFTALAAGGGNVKVSGALVAGGLVTPPPIAQLSYARIFAWAPDSSRIAYLATQDDATRVELFTSLPAGGGNTKVNAPLAAENLLPPAVWEFAWAPDAKRIAYVANQADNHRGEVFVAAPDGTGNAKLFDGAYEGYFAFGLAWSPDGAHVAGLGNTLGNFGSGLLSVAPAGGPAVPPSSAAGTLPLWSPDSSQVAFVGDGVHVSPLAVFGTPQIGPVVSSLAPGETLRAETLTWAPDGSRVAFLSEDLHVSFPTTSYGAERVTPHLHGTDRRVEKFQWTPDPWGIVFTADIAAAGVIEMFVSPRDAASLVTVSPPLVFGGQVLDFEVR